MINKILLGCFIVGSAFLFTHCDVTYDNVVNIKSIAAENVYLNFLGRLITVAPNSTVQIKDVRKGTYRFATTFDIPSTVTGASVEGESEGEIIMGPGTRVAIFYSSRIQATTGTGGTAGQTNYILIASISSSDDVNSVSSP